MNVAIKTSNAFFLRLRRRFLNPSSAFESARVPVEIFRLIITVVGTVIIGLAVRKRMNLRKKQIKSEIIPEWRSIRAEPQRLAFGLTGLARGSSISPIFQSDDAVAPEN